MKKIVFIAPVDYMSGSLSGRQDIAYNAQGARAYSMENGVHQSPNYVPRLIAIYRQKHPARFFMVRTKTSVNISAAERRSWALMGGAGAIYAALLRNKSAAPYTSIYNAYALNAGRVTFRSWAVAIIRTALANGNTQITFADGVSILNPWKNSSQTTGAEIPTDIVNKFASILS